MPVYATEEQGHRTKIGRSRPKIVIFWPFLAFGRHLGGPKDPLEVGVEVETCKTIDGTYFEGILSQKNWTGLAGGVKNGQFLVKIWLRSPPQAPEWLNNP